LLLSRRSDVSPSMGAASAPIRGSAAGSAIGVSVWKSAPLCADPRSVPSPPFAAALSGLGASARIDMKG
jgi:hypothetical protein